MVVNVGTLLRFHELLEFSVTGSQTLPREVRVAHLLCWRHKFALENFPAATTLLLANVIRVRVPEEEDSEEEQCQVTLSMVVEAVRLVPVGELTHILVGQRCLFTGH